MTLHLAFVACPFIVILLLAWRGAAAGCHCSGKRQLQFGVYPVIFLPGTVAWHASGLCRSGIKPVPDCGVEHLPGLLTWP